MPVLFPFSFSCSVTGPGVSRELSTDLIPARREDDDALVLVDRLVEAPLERVGLPVNPGVAFVEHDVAYVVLLQDLCRTTTGGMLEHPQRVPEWGCSEGREVPRAPDPGLVVGLHPSVPAHCQHGPTRGVVEVRGRDDAPSFVVPTEPLAGGDDPGPWRPVFGSRARACGLLA